MPSVKPPYETFAKIKVIGVGGSGNKAVQHMAAQEIRGVEFAAVNTDAQDLHHTKVSEKLHIGKTTTRGLGAGMNPDTGRAAAEENKEEIRELVGDADMVFVTYGLGGGTGSGAGPIVAEAAREAGALTVGVVTRPFMFEGRQRTNISKTGWEQLRRNVDAIVTIENDKILDIIDKQTSLLHAFKAVNEVLHHAVSGIAEVITVPGQINVDFADVKAVMEGAGTAHMGIGKGSGNERMIEAAKDAINSPLVDTSIAGAKGLLFSVIGGPGVGMQEVHEAASHITEAVDPDARIIFGFVLDRKLPKNQARITVIATGLNEPVLPRDDSVPGPRALRTPSIATGESGSGNGNGSAAKSGNGNEQAKGSSEVDEAKTVMGAASQAENNNGSTPQMEDDDPWEVPAFIRRKLKDRDKDK